MQPTRNTIFKVMTPDESYQILKDEKHDGLVWLIRESNVPGMLTVSFTVFSEYISVPIANRRYALTKSGWVSVSDMTEEAKVALKILQSDQATLEQKTKALESIQVSEMSDKTKEALKSMHFINKETAARYANQLYKIITSKPLSLEFDTGKMRIAFEMKNMVTPTQEMQTTNTLYKRYITT